MSGFVSLVGAGPGSLDLLTLKAAQRLKEADLVLYDGLVAPEVLQLAPSAHCFFVGKRAHQHCIEQEDIHALMIRAARRGQRVVRLKCGDPFVLGRGGEEALALGEAGVAFEIVPGVSSAIAGPALAGIPVTHRGLSSGFLVLSGHAESAYRSALDSIAPDSVTLVVLMGLSTRKEIASTLLARGWKASTPSALILQASLPEAWHWVGTLGELGSASLPDALLGAAGILCVGEVVSLASAISNPRLLENVDPSKFTQEERHGSHG